MHRRLCHQQKGDFDFYVSSQCWILHIWCDTLTHPGTQHGTVNPMPVHLLPNLQACGLIATLPSSPSSVSFYPSIASISNSWQHEPSPSPSPLRPVTSRMANFYATLLWISSRSPAARLLMCFPAPVKPMNYSQQSIDIYVKN